MMDLSFMKGSDLFKALGIKTGFNPDSPQELIQRACKLRQPMAITIDGRLTKFRSVFLKIDDNGETFYMGRLDPPVDEGFLAPNRTVTRISFDIYGIGRHFRAVFLGKNRVGNREILKFTVPEEIDTIQRREYFRVRPRLSDPVNVLFQHRESKQVTGAVDISAGGVCFNSPDRITPDVTLPSVIKLPSDYEPFRVKLNTRGVDKLQNPIYKKGKLIKPYRIRAQFKKLVIADLNALDKYIMDRQRDIIKIIR
ncbi:hypothetical protein MNBD_NITROSPINAE02-711 [hydrothermal vent metagenome]|uniref:Uncharacterized protein n=1 Tax=hydrothermal vent metagenome TaxID=652676 RepID=A0A3B1CCZ9_9ZZZZ